jgi:ribose 5-phosphate isomerase RpiB
MNDTIAAIFFAIGFFATIIGFVLGACKLLDIYFEAKRERNTRHKELVDKLNAIDQQLRSKTDR